MVNYKPRNMFELFHIAIFLLSVKHQVTWSSVWLAFWLVDWFFGGKFEFWRENTDRCVHSNFVDWAIIWDGEHFRVTVRFNLACSVLIGRLVFWREIWILAGNPNRCVHSNFVDWAIIRGLSIFWATGARVVLIFARWSVFRVTPNGVCDMCGCCYPGNAFVACTVLIPGPL